MFCVIKLGEKIDEFQIGHELINLKKKMGTASVSPYPEVHLRNGRLQVRIYVYHVYL